MEIRLDFEAVLEQYDTAQSVTVKINNSTTIGCSTYFVSHQRESHIILNTVILNKIPLMISTLGLS